MCERSIETASTSSWRLSSAVVESLVRAGVSSEASWAVVAQGFETSSSLLECCCRCGRAKEGAVRSE